MRVSIGVSIRVSVSASVRVSRRARVEARCGSDEGVGVPGSEPAC